MEGIPIEVLNYNGIELLEKYLPSVLETRYPYKEVIVMVPPMTVKNTLNLWEQS
ncbi:hypothetical protein RQ359_000218 [Sulfuracidifex metallicus DSM 6482 = JCM 9184]|nr:hypothetical protein [Sulfuracidifex metallicus]WOE50986.1 hypothetical protein RQ359_000218 [Sulfuracidifex metallicus DSM 6482 = JCM 9184]